MTPELRIDPATGALELAGLTRLAPWSGKRRARAVLAPFITHAQDMGTGYSWLYVQGLGFGGHPCWLDLCFLRGFFGSRLEAASFSIHLGEPPVAPHRPSSEEMDAELEVMRAELRRQLGEDRSFEADEKFAWGGAWCSYDPRSDTASGGLRYR